MGARHRVSDNDGSILLFFLSLWARNHGASRHTDRS